MSTILVSAPLPGSSLTRLEASGHQVLVAPSPYGLGGDGLIDWLSRYPQTEALISLLSDSVHRCVFNCAPDLRVIANYAVGVNNIDLEEAKRRGVLVTNTPGVLTEATADLTFALLLDACRHISQGDRLVRSGKWEGWSPSLLLGTRVTGATLGLIGFGRIGQAVAQRARGFSMPVLYHQRTRLPEAQEKALGARYVSLDELLEKSDIVSLHCPLTPSTNRLLSRERLMQMKPGAVLINASRGACVDEEALAELLSSGHVAAAGLDVYEKEPEVHAALQGLPNVVLAPHLGSADAPTREKMAAMCVESVLAVLEGREPDNRVI